MARIRSIKPEFPQSESMGRVSRDARLLFVLLWTMADDEGRGRGAQTMLARMLFPYDDDAPGRIGEWCEELEREECVDFYEVDGNRYFQVRKWRDHQKIDKPSKSKFPAPDGSTTERATERELESSIFNAIKSAGEFLGEKVVDVARQVRIGSMYLDVLVTTLPRKFVIEVKRDRVTVSDMRQVLRYAEASGAAPILIGRGLSPQFPVDECLKSGVAVLAVRDDGAINVVIPSDSVSECSVMLDNARECYRALRSARELSSEDQGRDQGRDQGKEKDSSSADADAPTSPKPDPIPYDAIVDLYRKHLPMLPDVRKLTDARKKKLRARWLEDHEHQTLDYWDEFFQYVAASDFLTGRDGAWTGCDFEWLVEAGNHLKVSEGKYENRGAA